MLIEAEAVGEVDPHLDLKAAARFSNRGFHEGALIRMEVEGGSILIGTASIGRRVVLCFKLAGQKLKLQPVHQD